MNERIKEFETLCEEYRPGYEGQEDWSTVFNKRKFAELIIRECMRLSILQSDASYVSDYIAKHFGIES